ncbi:MAG: aminoacyl-tRNA deacylase [Tepidiformaceae bacterium]
MTPQGRVQAAMAELELPGSILEFETSTHTAQEAADAVGCELGQIVKTLFFLADGRPTIALVAGDRHADTARLAQLLGVGRKKLRMGAPEEVIQATGYAVGGVSPIGLLQPCDIVIDDSLQRFDRVWAAAGSGSAVFPARTADLVRATSGQVASITRDVQTETA